MKIPRNLQLEDGEVLLVVSGKQCAIFYRIHGNRIDCVENFKVDKPEYTDFEGEFKIREHGNIIRRFVHEFRQRLGRIKFGISKIYLLAPAQTKNKIKNALPAESRGKLEKVVNGNFSHFHPIKLLERVYSN